MSIGGLLEKIFTGDGTGDPGAVGLLYQWYGGKIYQAAYYLLNDQHLAEDVVQETFLTVMNKLGTLRDPAKVEAWLVRAAINKSYDLLRGHREIVTLQDAAAVSEGDTVLDHLLDDELRREVIDALRQLPAINQEVAYYKFYHELNCQEISSILRMPVRTVRSRLKKSLELIAIYLGREVGETDAAGR
jgi:RNA polymerase sigma-70 factor (ECF subfamily)